MATPPLMEGWPRRIFSGDTCRSLSDERSCMLIIPIAMRGMLRDYDVGSEVPTGNGRDDLVLTPMTRGRSPSIVIEL